MGYDVSVRENFLPNDALNAVQAGKKLGFSAEIFLFSGHGAPGSVRFTNTYVEEMLTSNTMTSNSLYQMQNTKVAVWTSCHSATDPSNGVSIAQASINCGADAAVGWTAEIGNISAKKWSDAFFDYAKQGKNVYQAAIGAARQFSMTSDTCYTSIRVLGRWGIKMTSEAPRKRMPTSPYILLLEEQKRNDQLRDIEENYSEKIDGFGFTRYYKTVDGILTSDFYDIIEENDEILKSSTNFTEKEINEIKNYLEKNPHILNKYPSIPQTIQNQDGSIDCLKSQTEQTMIFKRNQEWQPLKVIFAIYEKPNGITYQKETCMNLINESLIDYAEICTIE